MNGNRMNSLTHERFPIGNGNFYAVMCGFSVKEIRYDHTSPSFCSLEHITEEGQFTKSQRIFGTSRWHTRLLRVANDSLTYIAEADDRTFPDMNAFVRSVTTSAQLRFSLTIPEGSKLTKAVPITYDNARAKCYWIKNIYANHEEILEIALAGEAEINTEEKTLILNPGESAIVFSMGTIPAIVQKASSKILTALVSDKLPEIPLLYKEESIKYVTEAMYALTVHFANRRGIIAASDDRYIRMLPLYTTLRLLNYIGSQKIASAMSTNALKIFLSQKDCVAIGRNDEGQYATDIFSLTPSLLMLSAFEAPNERFFKDMVSFLGARCRIQARTLVGGMLPFEGREYYYKKICPTTDGSAISTLFFIKSSEMICKNSDDKEMKEALDNAKSSFRENFITDGRIYLNSPKRSAVSRSPKYIYGICDFCGGELFTWLTKNTAGAFCCDDCLPRHRSHPAPNFGVKKESYLPALWSVYLDMDIFTAEEVTSSQDTASKLLDSIPLSDAALLLYSMQKYPHKAKQKVYDHIMAKRNSLGIWYDDKGEFDTLTNSLCIHAIITKKD